MTPADYAYLTDLVRKKAGIVLAPSDATVAETRMTELAKQKGLGGSEKLLAAARTQPTIESLVVQAMTTNETSFFRDPKCFQELQTHVLPELVRANKRNLKIWSAASSSGQEAYTIGIVGHGFAQQTPGVSIRIIASDLSQQMVDKGKSATYSQLEVGRGVPAMQLVRYFKQIGPKWKVKEEVAGMIEWRQANLLDWAPPVVDIVFLRNVLIYFDLPTKTAILSRVAKSISPGGYLVLGASEGIVDPGAGFERGPSGISPHWFRKKA